MKKNLNSHFGAFQGFETLNLYTSGAQIASAELGARFSVSLGTDPKRTRDLIHWAINDRMVAECPGPLRQLHALGEPEPEELFGLFGNLEADEEEEEPIKLYFNDDAESDSNRNESDMVQRRARKVAPMPSEEDTRARTSEEEFHLGRSAPETPTSSKESSDGKSSVVLPREQETPQDQEKREKKRIRIEKNRQAARRSNLSKKLKNEQIRDALKAEKERKDVLLEKESRLRLENSQLRKLCSNS